MDRAGEVLENAPDTVSEVEVKGIEIINFQDGIDVMLFESHS